MDGGGWFPSGEKCALRVGGDGERYTALMAGWEVFCRGLYWQHALAEAILAFPLFEVVSSCYKSQWGSGDADALADVVSQ
jgi:hypothetical protein